VDDPVTEYFTDDSDPYVDTPPADFPEDEVYESDPFSERLKAWLHAQPEWLGILALPRQQRREATRVVARLVTGFPDAAPRPVPNRAARRALTKREMEARKARARAARLSDKRRAQEVEARIAAAVLNDNESDPALD
jgi:hypothetical protein